MVNSQRGSSFMMFLIICIAVLFAILGFLTARSLSNTPYTVIGRINSVELYKSDWFVDETIRIVIDGTEYDLEEGAVKNKYLDIKEAYKEINSVCKGGNAIARIVVLDAYRSSTILELQINSEIYTEYDGAHSSFVSSQKKQIIVYLILCVISVLFAIGEYRGIFNDVAKKSLFH